MKSKKSLYVTIISVAIFCILAVIVGLLIFYFVSPDIKEVPENLKIEVIDNEYYLVTEANSNYDYQFIIEQQIEGEYVQVSEVLEENNLTNLSKNTEISLNAGNNFRFKAAYVGENGRNGNFSDYVTWIVVITLDEPVLKFENNVLSWNSVLNASSYSIKLISPNGEVEDIDNIQATSYDFSEFAHGDYKVYVTANGNEFFLSSTSLIFSFTVE